MNQLALEGIGRSVDPDAEFFPTPARLCDALVKVIDDLGLLKVEVVIEPSAGDGAFVRAARKMWPDSDILAIDIRDTAMECVAAGANCFEQADWTLQAIEEGMATEGPVLILGNPPFTPAQSHVEAGRNFDDGSVIAFLLRLGFLASAERKSFWKANPLRAMASITERPAFEKGKTDLHDYGLFIWQLGYRGKAELLPGVSWR